MDPLMVKLQALISATEAATGMMKIDDLHIAKSAVATEAEAEAEAEAEDIETQIVGRTRELIETEKRPGEFKSVKGGRVKY